jgi:fructose 1,6-bisphosphate aldolase/phosphatase
MALTTISCIKADVGSLAGHIIVPEEMKEMAKKNLRKNGIEKKLINDFHVFNCGDDLELLMTHYNGKNYEKIHKLAWDTFMMCADWAKKNKLYGAGQDLLTDAFSGNVKGLGPGVAEMTIKERKSDPLLVFACDKTEPSAFNLPLFKIFADPFNTAGLVIDPNTTMGFSFEVLDVYKHQKIALKCPEEMYELLALIGTTSTYAIKRVFKKGNLPPEEAIAAEVCTEKLSMAAGKYVGKDDPVCLVRSQSGFPATGEVLEGFALGHLVSGWMRGSHRGPLMPVAQRDATPTRFDGPPRVVGLGFQIVNGKLYGPRDLFDDVSFDITRKRCLKAMEYMRAHGPFEPHRVDEKELEYTTLPDVLKKLQPRFSKSTD